MSDRVKSIAEINVQEINVAVEVFSVFEGMNEALEMARAAFSMPKSLLSFTDDIMLLCKVAENDFNKTSPEFID